MNKMSVPPGAIPVLDKGFVDLVDHLGTDLTIVNAARVSYGGRHSAFDAEKDAKLLNYLAKNNHMSPFRHGVLQFHLKFPEFIARQIYKHVIGIEWTSGEGRFVDHAWNEISGRYVEYEPEFYVPTAFRPQGKDNKQVSGEGDLSQQKIGLSSVEETYSDALEAAYDRYEQLLKVGVAKEQARCVLPVCFYTEVYWTASLQAVCHLVKLRNHPHAQKEIQEYAVAIGDLAETIFPVSWKALMENIT